MKDILFHSHLGLGDQIGCNGLVHYLGEKYQCKIFVATKSQNLSNINFLYKDWSNIIPIGIEDSPITENQQIDKIAFDKNLELVRTTITTPNQGYWDESHYSNLGIDYQIKFDYCRLPDIDDEDKIVLDASSGNEKFAFVHNDPARDLTFTSKTDLFIAKNPLHLNVFQLSPILKRAEELHLMGSSILCLAELLNIPLSHQSAFFYRFRGAIKIRNFPKWNIID